MSAHPCYNRPMGPISAHGQKEGSGRDQLHPVHVYESSSDSYIIDSRRVWVWVSMLTSSTNLEDGHGSKNKSHSGGKREIYRKLLDCFHSSSR
jgi:hypothetical protein